MMFLILFFWQFEHLRVMLEKPLGQSFLICAVVMEIVGLVWVTRLFKTDD